MEEIKDFETFYAIKIEPNLAEFKQADNIIEQWKYAAVISALVFIPTLFASITGTDGLAFAWVLAGIVLVISTFNFFRKGNSFVDNYKEKVIKSIIEYLNPSLEYEPDLTIPQQEYRQSGLYRKNYDYYNGNDLVKGVYDGISFHCSELHTQYDSGAPYNTITTIFKGLFFASAVNAGYNSGTYVWSKDDEQLGVSIADEEYRLLSFPDTRRMSTGNALFDGLYSVYTTDTSQAVSILNEELINKLVNFRNQIKRTVVFSIVMGKCYVAIPVKEDLFEVPDDLDDKEEIKKCFFAVLLILSIIKQLNLKQLL